MILIKAAGFVAMLLILTYKLLITTLIMKKITFKQLSNSMMNSQVAEKNKENIKALKNLQIQKSNEQFCRHIFALTGLTVTPEYQFNQSRKWKIDFAIIPLKIAIEVEGGVFINSSYTDNCGNKIIRQGGRHNTGKGFIKDMEKYNSLAADNWVLIRATPNDLNSQKTTDFILKAIQNRSI